MTIGLMGGLGVMFCWGIADFIQAIAIRRIGTSKTMVVRNVLTLTVSALVGVGLALHGVISLDLANLAIIATSSFTYLLGYYSYMRGFEIGQVSVVAPIASAYSLVTVVLSVLILREGLTAWSLAAIAAIILGVVLTSANLRDLGAFRHKTGVKEALITMGSFGLAFFVLGFVSTDVEIATIFFYSSLSQAVFFIALGLVTGGAVSYADVQGNTGALFLVHAVLVNVGWASYIIGLSAEKVSIVAPLSAVFSAVTVVLALIIYREVIAHNQKLGIGIALCGIFLLSAST